MNKIDIIGEIGWDVTSEEVINKLKDISGDIEVHINSVGGSVYQGVAIFNALFEYDKGHITTINKGMAASMASYILLAGDTVKAYSNSTYMIHNALTFTYGNAKELRDTAKHLDALSNTLANMYVDKTGKPIKEIKQMMDDETYLYGSEMLENGFIDELVNVEKNVSKDSAIAVIKNEFASCLNSSKEHCKIEGYNKDIKDVLASLVSIPTEQSADKIENPKTGVDMSISKEEFDAIVSKADALEVSSKEAQNALEEANAKIELLEESGKKAEIIAFAGANRSVVSVAKEKEFLEAGATLQEVMDFALDAMENKPSENLNSEHDDDASVVDSIISAVIAKQNKGDL